MSVNTAVLIDDSVFLESAEKIATKDQFQTQFSDDDDDISIDDDKFVQEQSPLLCLPSHILAKIFKNLFFFTDLMVLKEVSYDLKELVNEFIARNPLRKLDVTEFYISSFIRMKKYNVWKTPYIFAPFGPIPLNAQWTIPYLETVTELEFSFVNSRSRQFLSFDAWHSMYYRTYVDQARIQFDILPNLDVWTIDDLEEHNLALKRSMDQRSSRIRKLILPKILGKDHLSEYRTTFLKEFKHVQELKIYIEAPKYTNDPYCIVHDYRKVFSLMSWENLTQLTVVCEESCELIWMVELIDLVFKEKAPIGCHLVVKVQRSEEILHALKEKYARFPECDAVTVLRG